MYYVKTLNKIAKEGLDLFDKEQINVSEKEENYDGVILRSYNLKEEVLPLTCKAVARAGAGVNNINIEECSKRGIVVMNTPGANANSVKELVLGAMFMAARNINKGIDWIQTLSKDEDVASIVEKEKSNFKGNELLGKRVGVIGLGAIGVLVANALNDLGMEVYGYDPYLSVEAAWKINKNINRSIDLEKIFKRCDYITIHVPLNDSTRDTVNEELLSKAKKGITIINLARGGLVNDDAIIKAVESKKVKYYITDFPNEKLLGYENIICIPHLGASTPESETNCAKMAVTQLEDLLINGNISNSVNYPNCEMGPLNGNIRICITHENVPNMVSQISTILAKAEVNIGNMINKSKGEYAYTMIDVDSMPNDEAVELLNTIEKVSGVRLIYNK